MRERDLYDIVLLKGFPVILQNMIIDKIQNKSYLQKLPDANCTILGTSITEPTQIMMV